MLGVGLSIPQIAIRRYAVNGVSFSPEAEALFARFTGAPDNTRKTLIDQTIVDLMDANLWSKIDYTHCYAAHDAQAASLNWKSTSFTLTLISTPTFTVDRDYTTNGSTTALNTNYNPTVAAGNFTLNDAGGFVWSRTSGTQAASIFGWNSGGTGSYTINNRTAADGLQIRVNSTGSATQVGITDGTGLFTGSRVLASGASAVLTYRNGVAVGSHATASTGLVNDTFRLGATSATINAAVSVSWSGAGSSFSAQNNADLYTILQAYMTAVGA